MADSAGRYVPGFLPPLEALAQTDGQGSMVPTPGGPKYPLRLPDADLRRIRAHVTPHSARTIYDRLATGDPAAVDLPHTYNICPTPGQSSRFAPLAQQAQRNGWARDELAGGHFALVTMPAELNALLSTQASG